MPGIGASENYSVNDKMARNLPSGRDKMSNCTATAEHSSVSGDTDVSVIKGGLDGGRAVATLVGMTILSAMEDLLNAVRHYHANGDKVRSMQDLCDKWERLNTAMGGSVTAVYGSGLPHAGHCYGLILAAQTLEQAGNDAEAVWQSAAEACLASVS